MSRKDALNSLFLGKATSTPSASSAAKSPDRVRSGAIGAMGSSLQELTQGARAAAKLQEQLIAGDHVVTLDANLIDQSPIADRLSTEIDPGFDELVESIERHGQQVPILVRPSSSSPGRFQIAYGRRRLRALVRLAQPVKAIVKNLTDEEVVVAQGRENLDRADLSFIEKALFARRLEDAGYERPVIMSALGTDKSDLSRYISIARRVSEDMARQIGPARKAGRARWHTFTEALGNEKNADNVEQVLNSDKFKKADSDTRFNLVLKAATPSPERPVKSGAWNLPEGRRAALIQRHGTKTVITFDEKRAPEFASFVSTRLDALFQEFQDEKEEKPD